MVGEAVVDADVELIGAVAIHGGVDVVVVGRGGDGVRVGADREDLLADGVDEVAPVSVQQLPQAVVAGGGGGDAEILAGMAGSNGFQMGVANMPCRHIGCGTELDETIAAASGRPS